MGRVYYKSAFHYYNEIPEAGYLIKRFILTHSFGAVASCHRLLQAWPPQAAPHCGKGRLISVRSLSFPYKATRVSSQGLHLIDPNYSITSKHHSQISKRLWGLNFRDVKGQTLFKPSQREGISLWDDFYLELPSGPPSFFSGSHLSCF
jgi:hypothetical protein